MEKTKSGIVCQYVLTVIMYLSHVFLWAMAIFAVKDVDGTYDAAVGAMLVGAFVFLCVAALAGVLCVVFAIVNLFRDSQDCTKSTVVCKLCLIPWYIVNFVFWLLLVAGFCNPWLFVGVPVVIVVGVTLTWWAMLCGGVANLSYAFRLVRQGTLRVTTKLVVAIVFHFVFLLDIVGAFLLRDEVKRIPRPVEINDEADPFENEAE